MAVQDPAEAGYDGMPRSAIGTGLVDLVLKVGAIPAALSADRVPPASPDGGLVEETDMADPAAGTMQDILALLRVEAGQDFALYKSGTLGCRVSRRVALAGLRPTGHGRLSHPIANGPRRA